MKVRTRARWQNTIKKIKVTPVKIIEPESLQDIVSIIKEAESKNLKVRAVASGHSFSDVMVTHDYLVDLFRLIHIDHYKIQVRKDGSKETKLVECQAGIRIRELNLWLDKMGMALINMGAVDHQKLAGVISTGTHGTGKDLEAMQGFVRSMVLVAGGGKIYRIEKNDGITDPLKFNEPGVELIQDDETFYSAVLSFGSMGIIYSFVLEVTGSYFLRETKLLTNWESLKKKWHDGSIFVEGDSASGGTAPRGVTFMINPYKLKNKKTGKEEFSCAVMRNYITTKPPKKNLFRSTRNLLSYIFGNFPFIYYYTLFTFNKIPHQAPKLLRSSINGSRDKEFTNKSFKVLFQGFQFLKERAYSSELAFDMKNPDTAINAIEKLMDNARRIQEDGRLYHSSPITVRFVKRSKAFLAPEFERDVAYIDIPFLLNTKGTETMLEICQQIMFDSGGIPHWGKSNSILDGKPEFLAAAYPELVKWKTALMKFNPSGTFNNAFMERIGII
jgi:L-gulono-1,4-lactone dehydrogenase